MHRILNEDGFEIRMSSKPFSDLNNPRRCYKKYKGNCRSMDVGSRLYGTNSR